VVIIMELSSFWLFNVTEHGACRRRLLKYGTCKKSDITIPNIKEAEKFNELVKSDAFDLDYICTEGVLLIARRKTPEAREKLLSFTKATFKTDIDPVTKQPITRDGITVPMIRRWIAFINTGRILSRKAPKIRKLSAEDIEIIQYLKECGQTCAKARLNTARAEQIAKFCDDLLKDVA